VTLTNGTAGSTIKARVNEPKRETVQKTVPHHKPLKAIYVKNAVMLFESLFDFEETGDQ